LQHAAPAASRPSGRGSTKEPEDHVVNGPYSSALLNEPAPRTAPAPTYAPVPAYAAAPMAYAPQQYAPQPQYVQARARGSRLESALFALIALIVVAIMAVAGYMLAQGTAPSAREYAASQNIAGYNGFLNGRQQGIQQGRDFAVANNSRITQLQALIARQKQFNRGFAQGKRDGLGQYARRRTPSYGGYRTPYRAPRWSTPSYGGTSQAVSGAIAAAQQYANATGSTVDVEVG
jgi:hypothetical protein